MQQDFRTKRIFLTMSIIICILTISGLVANWQLKQWLSTPQQNQIVSTNAQTSESQSIGLILQEPGGEKKQAIVIPKNSTVFDALAIASKQNGFSLKTKQYPFGIFIDELDGLASDKLTGQYWTYSINGQFASVGASSYVAKDGDIITWRYGK